MEKFQDIRSKWNDFEVQIKDKLLTKNFIRYSLDLFWNEEILNIKEDQFILIQFKVKISAGIIRSISHVQTVQKKDYNILLESFLIFWDIRSEDYKLTEVES